MQTSCQETNIKRQLDIKQIIISGFGPRIELIRIPQGDRRYNVQLKIYR